MDRFIDDATLLEEQASANLKSSLDRFIGADGEFYDMNNLYLKSSLDRFIAWMVSLTVATK